MGAVLIIASAIFVSHAGVVASACRERGSRGRPQADINCLQGKEVVWSDIVQGAAVAACGSQHFAAVALQDGHLLVRLALESIWPCLVRVIEKAQVSYGNPASLQVYSAAGRRLSAPLKLGAGIARLACDQHWRLLALTTSGSVQLFDVGTMACVSKAALGPLLEDGAALQGAALSRNGVPLITLSNSRVYAFSPGMGAWMCVADESCATSQFMPLLRLREQGKPLHWPRRGAASSGGWLRRGSRLTQTYACVVICRGAEHAAG